MAGEFSSAFSSDFAIDPAGVSGPEGGFRSEASLANVDTLRAEIDRSSGALRPEAPQSWVDGILDTAGVAIQDTAGFSIADTGDG